MIVWSIFSPTLSLSNKDIEWYVPSLAGVLLIGWVFGLAYSRYFKIKEIDK
jgi:hypothetical protein